MSVSDSVSPRRVRTRTERGVLSRPKSAEDRARDASTRHRANPTGRGLRAVTLEQAAAGGPGGRPGAGPWHYAKHVSAYLDPEADTRVTRRHIRTSQREVLWRASSLERVRKCGRVPVGEVGDVLLRDKAGVAHYANLATCGSIWACPVCAAKIRSSRAEEISDGTARWAQAGNEVYMLTFTAPHDLGMRLAPLVSTVADGFRSVVSGRAWVKLRDQLGIVGQIRSMEVTHGENGWHPHLHVLVYIEGNLDARGLLDFTLHMRDRWRRFIVKAGYRPPSDEHGVVIDRCLSAKEAGLYIAKTQDGGKSVGNEMARGDMKQGRKGGRTAFEILDDFRWTGDAGDLRLVHEHEKATHGRQCITWSKGLRQLLTGTEEERSDEDLAAEEVGGHDIASIPGETWRAITKIPGLSTALLDELERGGLNAV
ncbi:MAG: hypothetical protein JWL97_4095, partial [Gemmatimonadales bacterium]|nr:hypothetical protein [Gemmatimonadales bacterium]